MCMLGNTFLPLPFAVFMTKQLVASQLVIEGISRVKTRQLIATLGIHPEKSIYRSATT